MSSTILASDLISSFEEWAPMALAYDWDNVGLQVGTLNKQVKKVMITLDVLENVVNEAVENKIDLIVAHHPLLFKSLKQINTDEPAGRIIKKLLQHNITVYAAHTNLDITSGGVSDMLADTLNIHNTQVLIKSKTEKLYKLIVYVPEEDVDALKEAIGNAGAGFIGNYCNVPLCQDTKVNFLR